MTTIAWDGKSLAGDRMLSIGSAAVRSPKSKIQRIVFCGEESLVGGAGSVEAIGAFICWLKSGGADDRAPLPSDSDGCQYSVIVANRNGVYYFANSTKPVFLGKVAWAIGSGADYALGAIAAGVSSKKAVQIASKYDTSTGMGVDSLSITPRA